MTSRYEALATHLRASPGARLEMTFSEVATLVGNLPASASEHRAWWSNTDSHTHARNGWLAAGWETSKVDMAAHRLTFVRVANAIRNPKKPVAVDIGLRSPAPDPYHDSAQSGLSQIEHRAGGAANLLEILRAVERYVEGEIVETELGRVIRRSWGRTG